MARRPRVRPGRRRRLTHNAQAAALCLALLALAPAGCASGLARRSTPPQASRLVLPHVIGVHAAIAAGEASLAGRGYTIDRDEATASEGVVVGVGQTLGFLQPKPRVRIEARMRGEGVEVVVKRFPRTNAEADRDLLAEIRARLGAVSIAQ